MAKLAHIVSHLPSTEGHGNSSRRNANEMELPLWLVYWLERDSISYGWSADTLAETASTAPPGDLLLFAIVQESCTLFAITLE
jgi:hypothetical protein